MMSSDSEEETKEKQREIEEQKRMKYSKDYKINKSKKEMERKIRELEEEARQIAEIMVILIGSRRGRYKRKGGD